MGEFSIEDQKAVLKRLISRASGRQLEVLNALYGEFPKPMTEQKLMHTLNFTNLHTFKSMLRNACLVIDIEQALNVDGEWEYRLSDKEPKAAVCWRWIHSTQRQA